MANKAKRAKRDNGSEKIPEVDETTASEEKTTAEA